MIRDKHLDQVKSIKKQIECHWNNSVKKPDSDLIKSLLEYNLYIVCFTPRSGSSLLARALQKTQTMGKSCGDLLNIKVISNITEKNKIAGYSHYLYHIITTYASLQKVFGFKADYFQLAPLFDNVDFWKIFRNAKWIYLTREDLLGQSISRAKGLQTKSWNSTQKATGTICYDKDFILRQLEYTLEVNSSWEYFFALNKIKPLRITYESLCNDLNKVLQQISISINVDQQQFIDIKSLSITKQADSISDEWRNKFYDEFNT